MSVGVYLQMACLYYGMQGISMGATMFVLIICSSLWLCTQPTVKLHWTDINLLGNNVQAYRFLSEHALTEIPVTEWCYTCAFAHVRHRLALKRWIAEFNDDVIHPICQ